MKRLTLIFLYGAIGLACDLGDKSLGDTGNASDSESGDSDPGDSDSDPGDSDSDPSAGEGGIGCTEIGCEDGLFVTLRADPPADGAYEVQMIDGSTGMQHLRCDFQVSGGEPEDPDCNVFRLPGEGLFLTLPADLDQVEINVFRDGVAVGSVSAAVEYEDVAPNGPECEPICTQGNLSIPLAEPVGCDQLEEEFQLIVEEVRGCTLDNECGQVIEDTSCGCTRDWVARNDADLTAFWDTVAQGAAEECSFAGFGSVCDCPEADGFACVDNTCTWNYVGG